MARSTGAQRLAGRRDRLADKLRKFRELAFGCFAGPDELVDTDFVLDLFQRTAHRPRTAAHPDEYGVVRLHNFTLYRGFDFVLDHFGGRDRGILVAVGDDEGDAVDRKVEVDQLLCIGVGSADARVERIIERRTAAWCQVRIGIDVDLRECLEAVDFVDTATASVSVHGTELDHTNQQVLRIRGSRASTDSGLQHFLELIGKAVDRARDIDGNRSKSVFRCLEFIDDGARESEATTDFKVVHGRHDVSFLRRGDGKGGGFAAAPPFALGQEVGRGGQFHPTGGHVLEERISHGREVDARSDNR